MLGLIVSIRRFVFVSAWTEKIDNWVFTKKCFACIHLHKTSIFQYDVLLMQTTLGGYVSDFLRVSQKCQFLVPFFTGYYGTVL